MLALSACCCPLALLVLGSCSSMRVHQHVPLAFCENSTELSQFSPCTPNIQLGGCS